MCRFSTDPVGALEHDDVVARAGELLGDGEPGRARSDHGDTLAGPHRRHVGRDPPFVPGTIDDLDFDLLDGDGVLVDAQHTRRLTRSRTQPPGELREVVRGMQPLDGILPVVAVDEIVPVGDQVPERAPVVAEGDTAVHATPRLMTQLAIVEVLVHLLPVAQAYGNRAPRRRLTIPLQETGWFTHQPLAASMILSTVCVSSSPAASDSAITVSTRW
jgi:hypothetical protein